MSNIAKNEVFMFIIALAIMISFSGNIHSSASKKGGSKKELPQKSQTQIRKDAARFASKDPKKNMLERIKDHAEKEYENMTKIRSTKNFSYDLACIFAAYDLKKSAENQKKRTEFEKMIEELESQYDKNYEKQHSIK